ncbi:MAG: GIY-YIG nuclease family protein [bacterium]|nr:GIY-YIG nuclease family protein [bacterium]
MPGSTTLNLPVLFWVYVIESIESGKRYIGFTTDLMRRLEEHGKGRSRATAPYIPFRLIYVEGCANEADARRREHYFKVSEGRRYLAKRLLEHNAARRFAS